MNDLSSVLKLPEICECVWTVQLLRQEICHRWSCWSSGKALTSEWLVHVLWETGRSFFTNIIKDHGRSRLLCNVLLWEIRYGFSRLESWTLLYVSYQRSRSDLLTLFKWSIGDLEEICGHCFWSMRDLWTLFFFGSIRDLWVYCGRARRDLLLSWHSVWSYRNIEIRCTDRVFYLIIWTLIMILE